MHPRFRHLRSAGSSPRFPEPPYDELGDRYEDRHSPPHTEEPEPWREEPRRDLSTNRLTHLVLVDGRLVDFWSEPVEHSPWAAHAEAIDRERLPAPHPPDPPLHQVVLAWLVSVCGSAEAVDTLDAEPLTSPGPLPEPDDVLQQLHLRTAAEKLDAVAARLFDAETAIAFRNCLLAIWDVDRDVALRCSTGVHLAGGVVRTVGRANGLLGQGGVCTQKRVSMELDLGPNGLTSPGQLVENALYPMLERAFRPWQVHSNLEAVGRPDLLVASTRRRLVRLRDQARAGAAAAGSAPFYRDG